MILWFGYSDQYKGGGAHDFAFSSDTLEEGRHRFIVTDAARFDRNTENMHAFDTFTEKIVERWCRDLVHRDGGWEWTNWERIE